MKITHTLIKKFLENRCNAAEAIAVARYLKKHPELMTMYVRSSWDAADKETVLPTGYADEMLEVINVQIGKNTRVLRFRWFAAAASFFMLLAVAWLYSSEISGDRQVLATTVTLSADSVQWKHHHNASPKAYSIKLQDGSVVKLAPDAIIKYPEPFEADRRIVYVEGEADFNVVQDKSRPFTVRTKLFSTTVLGTSFRVSENATGCNIKLFTGKVLIKALADTLPGWRQDVILLPGNQMEYDQVKSTVTIERFNRDNTVKQPTKNEVATMKDPNKMVFDNTPLSDVMQALIQQYHLPIEYNEDLLAGKYFSGEVLKEDSLPILLKVIANMNGLQVTEKENGFLISKSK